MAQLSPTVRAGDGAARVWRWAGDALLFALLILVAVFVLTPFVWLFSTSLRLPRESFTLPPKWLPTDFHIQNYLTVFESVDFFRFFRNSVILSGLSVVGQLIFASMAAYAFARLRFPAKNLLFILLMAGLMIPIQATIIPVFILIGRIGLNDSLWSLILPSWSSAFGVFLLRQYFLTIPNDLEDAARVDGASVWRIYWSVMLPLVRPALAVLAILTFNASWNEYFRPFIFLTSPEVFTLPLGLVTLRGYLGSGSVAVVLAGVVLALLPTFVLYIFSQRYLVEGITATGIKG
jgi:multiple sugar transport system permease protein